ncbi:MAG TPA: NADH-quinone oxidoreductase subunit H [Alphaproteobacteria bacterium]|jgi:formate hydrogenlyase subunit 4|nr:NADH-quinone oxidoreductase subunit H [Alphaproteobacteria bacterium]
MRGTAIDLALQILQLSLVLVLAPALTGLTRRLRARLMGRKGPGLFQPYRDLVKLLRKEAVLAENASWLYRSAPYMIFALLWLAAALVPTFTTRLPLSPAADLIALVALIGAARFLQALAGMDVGTSFGGIGASREMMIASLAEPAMLLVIFTMALFIQSTSIPSIAEFVLSQPVGIRVSFALALIALIMVAIAESARIPVDNPATHLELTMVHEAMVLEYSGRHLALIEAASMMKLLFYVSLIAGVFAPWGLAPDDAGIDALAIGACVYAAKLIVAGTLLSVFEASIAKMRVFRVGEYLGGALLLGLLGTIFLYVSQSL